MLLAKFNRWSCGMENASSYNFCGITYNSKVSQGSVSTSIFKNISLDWCISPKLFTLVQTALGPLVVFLPIVSSQWLNEHQIVFIYTI